MGAKFDGTCITCGNCEVLGYKPGVASTVSYWCDRNRCHVGTGNSCESYRPGDPWRVAMELSGGEGTTPPRNVAGRKRKEPK